MLKTLFIIPCMLAMATSALAFTVDNSTLWNTTALTGYATTGAMMDGMTVTATFLDGGTQTAIWADTSSDSGSAAALDFVLKQSYDTFSNNFTLSSTASMRPIQSLKIDAGAGNSVFDVLYDPTYTNFYSPGSANGRFEIGLHKDTLTMDVTFSGPVAIDNVFYGDLYRFLTIDFTNPEGYFGYNFFKFYADTDSLLYAGDITPGTAVPEPSTLLLLGAGCAGLVFWRKRKRIA